MKKAVSIILFLFISLSLVACVNTQKHISVTDTMMLTDDTMTIQKSEFSEETQEVLKIMENEVAFFDYEVDETIKSISIDLWTYEDEKWISSGGTSDNINPSKKRIAIRQTQNSCDIFELDDSGYTKYTYDNIVDFSECNMQTYYRLETPINIEIGKEITLWANYGTSKNALSLSENFRTVDCHTGIAATITFSDKSID